MHYLCNELPTVFVEVNPREWTYEKFRYLLLTLGFEAKYNTLKAGQLSTGTKSVEGYWCDIGYNDTFVKKQDLAKKLDEKNITLYYLMDNLPTVFVELNPKSCSQEKVQQLFKKLGFKIKQNSLRNGIFATSYHLAKGYWCDLC